MCQCVCAHSRVVEPFAEVYTRKHALKSALILLLSHISPECNVPPIHATPFKSMVGLTSQSDLKLNMLMPSKGATDGEKTNPVNYLW